MRMPFSSERHGDSAAPVSQRNDLVSVGRYALRGVKRPQELFTLMHAA